MWIRKSRASDSWTIFSRRATSLSDSPPRIKRMTLLDLRSFAMSNRLQNGLCTASWKFLGPLLRLLTAVTSSSDSTSRLSFWMRSRYRGEEISLEETASTSCGWDGKLLSILFDCAKPGSLVEKKKFSSTTGLRSTNTATRMNNTAATASISQCAPDNLFQIAAGVFIELFRSCIGVRRHALCPEECIQATSLRDEATTWQGRLPPQRIRGRHGRHYKISIGHFGSACMNARPYGLVTIRLSKITMIP